MRLRLRLALLTMAVVPAVISLALVYAVAGTDTEDAQARAGDHSAALSASIGGDLDRVRSALVLAAADPAIREIAARDAAPSGRLDQPLVDAHEALLALARAGAGTVPSATILDARGRTRLRVEDDAVSTTPAATRPNDADGILEAARAKPVGEVHRARPYVVATGEYWVTFATRLPPAQAGAPSAGVLRLEINLAAVLRRGSPGMSLDGRSAVLVDESTKTVLGGSIAASGSAPGVNALMSFLTGSGDGWRRFLADGWVAGVSRLSSVAPGLEDWTVVILDRAPPPAVPVVLLAVLGGVSVVLVVIARWMAHQILRPAEQLELSRSELRRLYEAARADSLRDVLTGLGNHRAFQEELDRQLEWFRRYKVPVSLLLIDLDDLKVVNDTQGHGAGDEMLREMGRIIADAIRYADRAFRIGGDEFAVLMPHTDADGALLVARRLQASGLRAGTEGLFDGRAIRFSAGISACPTSATTRGELYAQADAALYWCKRHGRSSVDIYDPAHDREAPRHVHDGLAASIHRVVERRLLRPVYQPIVELSTGRIIGYEGLIRPTPESGFADPGALFTAAEAVGRTVELDHACLETVIDGARAIALDQRLTVNLSPRTIEATGFSATRLLDLLARYGMDPRRVVVELTEREDVHDLERVRRNLLAIQAAGMRIAADDVGAGNSGLRLLSQVRFDIVKIDLSLVQEGATNEASRAVLTSLRDLARGWKAYLVAEGLETPEQLRVVRELGVSAGQGYLLGKPKPDPDVPPVDIEAILGGVRVMGGPLPVGAAQPIRVG